MSLLRRLLADAPTVSDAPASSDPDDPVTSLGWLVRMAQRTESHRSAKVDADQLAQLEAQLRERPERDEDLGQLHITAASCLRRAELVLRDGPILAVGDDDAVSLALKQLGAGDVHVADLDERLLTFLGPRIDGTRRVNVLEESVPDELRARFASVVTDPFRDLDGGLGFLCFAAACVRDGGDLFWVDHPDWNYEHHEVAAAMAKLGWRVVETHEHVHAYPLTLESFDPARILRELDVEKAWLHALISETCAWSNLLRFRRDSRLRKISLPSS